MKFAFNFGSHSEVAQAMGKTAQRRFNNASDRKMDHHNKDDKAWVKEVVGLFAYKCFITKAQAIQVLCTDGIEYIQKMHTRAAVKLPEHIMAIDPEDGQMKKVKNPLRERLEAFGSMQEKDHRAMCRENLAFAAAIRHPKDTVPKDRPSKLENTDALYKAAIQGLQHADETRRAHRERMKAVLAQTLGCDIKTIEILGGKTLENALDERAGL